MSKTKKRVNPFYILLVIVGIVFTLTACGYGVMIYQETQQIRPDTMEEGLSFTRLMSQHGVMILCVELILLAIFTVSSIGLDQYWISRDEKNKQQENTDPENATQNDTAKQSETT